MDLKSLRKPKLLELARELGLDVSDKLRKPELLRAILELEAEDDELSECLETIEEREQKEKEERERKEQKEKDERERKEQKEKEERERKEQKEKEKEERDRQHALEMKRLEVEMERARNGSQAHGAGERVSFKMTDLMRPFKLGEDIGLFLVNFERTCEKQGFSRETWPQRLLTLLPAEAADVVARLKREEAEDFDQVKSSLLKKYRLSAEAFRRKFRENEKGRNESYTEFAYRLMSNMQEWLKEEKAFGDHEKILQCFGLEQFYSRLPENVRYWVLDRPDVSTVAKAAELAEEFVTRRARGAKDGQKGEFGSKSERPKFTPMRARGDTRSADASESSPTERKETAAAEAERRKRFERRQARVCYTCQKPGHFSAQCPETKREVVCLSLCSTDENMKLLEPYMRDFLVNGKECRVLRDSAATMDVVHTSYVEPDMFTGECAWIKQAVEAHSVCLPVAKVLIEGPFGALETEAVVSSRLPPQYPYLFSNRSDHLLREKGLLFGEASVQALTRPRVRELAAKAVVAGPTLSNNEKGSEAQQADIPSTSELDKIEPVALKAPGTGEEMPDKGKLEELPVELPGLGSVTNREDTDQVISDLLSKAPLSPEQKTELHQLLQEFQGQFSERPGRTSVLTHDIELTSPEPVRSKAYRVSPRQRDIMEAEVKKMLQLGVIEAGESDYTSPLILVEVPGKEPRPCVDYRRLNSITKDQIYPIPNIEERLEKVSSAQFISTLDLVRGYWQVPLTEEASRYAAFISPMGTFRPKVLSFGLKNAPYCFSSLMDKVLRGQEEFALPYLDDVAIFSASWSEHMAHLRAVLTRLREAGLTVKAPKCQLAQAEVVYLGHVIGQGRRRPSEIKVAAVRDFPQPRTKTDIRSFLGVAGYYQRYIPRYSDIAAPLTDALRKTEPQTVVWSETKERAFSALKSALTSQPVLRSPDYTKGFVVQCDASERGMGVVLCQRDNGEVEHPVLYASRKLTCREQAYSATEKECACLVWAVQKLSCYLAGSRFIIETDHCPLQWLQTISPKNGRLLRWSLALQQYSFEVRYKKGSLNGNADGLSRSP
ncbi:hypothetical protein V5799_014447 [Amblyomma americanum]|uniref:Tick transposon n=1 Tax=Amblyomma americanum TaxID=6943 RepID=A0AAQ4E303_AMBAM